MTHVMTLTERARDGADIATATFAGREFQVVSRTGATMALARELMAAGAPDGLVEARGPDGRTRFTAQSLYRLAELTISETDRGIRLVPWRPYAVLAEAA